MYRSLLIHVHNFDNYLSVNSNDNTSRRRPTLKFNGIAHVHADRTAFVARIYVRGRVTR